VMSYCCAVLVVNCAPGMPLAKQALCLFGCLSVCLSQWWAI